MLEVIKRTGAFLIIAETMYQFVQEDRYARYVRLLIRLMTLAILILPICDLFREGSSALFYERLHDMEDEFAVYTEEQRNGQGVTQALADVDTEQEVREQATAQIRKKCAVCAEQNGYYIADMQIRENGVIFYLEKAEKEEAGIYIEPVIVQNTPEQEKTRQYPDSTAENETARFMEKQFAQCLGVSQELIEVRMDERMEG